MNLTTLLLIGAAAVVVAVLYVQDSADAPRPDRATSDVIDSLPAVTGRVTGDGWQGTITITNPARLWS